MDPYEIILHPVMTEVTSRILETENKLVFIVSTKAKKADIKRAVEELYEVKAEKINTLIHVGDHGTTFGGGPVTTAVASKVWDILSNPQFIAQIRDNGAYLAEKLEVLSGKYSFLGGLCGRGLLQGIEVLQENLPRSGENSDAMPALLAAFREEGMLILRSGQNILRIAPPLIIGTEEIDTGITIMARVFDRIESGEIILGS